MNAYQYEKLDSDLNHFRLVKLLPAISLDDDLRCELFHAPLERAAETRSERPSLKQLQETVPRGWIVRETLERRYLFSPLVGGKPSWSHPDSEFAHVDLMPPPTMAAVVEYEALSYTWEPVGQCEALFVSAIGDQWSTMANDKLSGPSLLIGQNLASALRHLRLPAKPRILWIDAVCINQKDIVERNEQVRRMGEIYEFADRVVVWLGDAVEDGDRLAKALLTLEYIGSQVECTRDGYTCGSPDAVERNWQNSSVRLPYGSGTWDAIQRLLYFPWFQRLWVFQEIQLANERAIVQIGSASIRASRLGNALQVLRENEHMATVFSIQLLNYAFDTIGFRRQQPISQLLDIATSRKCSDPRDKVYAILGLTPPSFSAGIRPDYDLPIAEVFKTTVLAHIDHSNRLDLLPRGYMTVLSTVLPSWVPNWNGYNALYGLEPSNASGMCRAHATYISPNILEVIGVHAASVNAVTEAAPAHDEGTVATMRKWYAESREAKGLKDCSQDACATVLSGLFYKDRCSDVESYPSLEAWKNFLGEEATSRRMPISQYALHHGTRTVQGRGLLCCDKNTWALGPASTRKGDLICILLGCRSPVILRSGTDGHFRLVGQCLASGLLDATGLLGQIPAPWKARMRIDKDNFSVCQFLNVVTGEETVEDPRLPPLPPPWERIDVERTNDHPMHYQSFRNTATGEVMNSDPRMLPDALRARGVPLRTFQLV